MICQRISLARSYRYLLKTGSPEKGLQRLAGVQQQMFTPERKLFKCLKIEKRQHKIPSVRDLDHNETAGRYPGSDVFQKSKRPMDMFENVKQRYNVEMMHWSAGQVRVNRVPAAA